jgi:endogenous inhibitor of DNA gyrase (YacG/DUF329 family)
MSKNLVVKCSRCKKEFNYYASDYRPFCSEKCKMVDLGHWLTESYAIPVEKMTEEMIEELEEAFSKQHGIKNEDE